MDREDIIRMAREAGFGVLLPSVDCRGKIYAGDDDDTDEMEHFAALVAAAEREACIEILSRTEFTSLEHMPSEAALIIRARGGE